MQYYYEELDVADMERYVECGTKGDYTEEHKYNRDYSKQYTKIICDDIIKYHIREWDDYPYKGYSMFVIRSSKDEYESF